MMNEGRGEAERGRRSAQQTDAWVWPSSSWCVPPVETQVVTVVPLGHPRCFFFFFLSFFSLNFFSFSFPSFFAVFSSFSVSPPLPLLVRCFFSFVLSFGLLIVVFRCFVSPSLLLVLLSCFLGDRFCCSVIPARRYTPLALLRAWSMRILLACCLLSCVVDVIFIFTSLPSLFQLRFGHRLFHPVFLLAGTMLSPRFRFLLRLV